MVLLLERDGYYCAYACGTDLGSDWDNDQAKLAVAELNAMDWFISASIYPTRPKTVKANPNTAAHYPKRLAAGRMEGRITNTHYLQTGILTNAVMGACSTAGAGDPYTHTITKDTNTSPFPMAFHYEKEGTNSSPRWDFMGIIPRALDIYCSERDPIARQVYTAMAAFTYDPADNLAQPTAFTQATLRPLTWFDLKHASAATEFLYNSGAINIDQTEIHLHLGWTGYEFGTYNSSGYPTDGWYKPPFEGFVEIGGRRTDAAGTDINDIVNLAHTSYAGDLDYVADFYVGANDYLKYTYDKMYLDPDSFQEVFQNDAGSWYDGVKFRLDWLNETSSLAVEEKNHLSKAYYENT